MKRIEIEILKSGDALKAAVDTWHDAEKGKRVTPRISFGGIKDLFAAITEKRLELLRYVAGQQNTMNTRQLAQALGRDYKNDLPSCSRIQRRITDWRPTLVVDQVVGLGRHCRAVCLIGPAEMLTVPASNRLSDTISATGDVTVPDVTWWGCLIRYTAVQADNTKYRYKELHPPISHLSGNVGFCMGPSQVCKLCD